ncbi:MAG: sulfatase [Acidobacteria bacterium]|nr:MAG: sulfatase [Acidobacteriota bacterium]
MGPIDQTGLQLTRRHFFGQNATGIGMAALAGLLGNEARAQGALATSAHGGLPGLPHFAPKAKRVIYLFQSGGPSQMELFDYKPRLAEFQGQDLPESVRMGQRLTGMSATQSSFPVVPSKFAFARRGNSGAWVSELLPYTAKAADELTFIKSLHTEAINHDPAVTFIQTGSQIAGRPSIGAWLSYGIGCVTEDLPAFVVMISPGSGTGGQPLYDRLWGSGFLPSRYQGVKFRSVGDPVLYLSNPSGFNASDRRRFLTALDKLNQINSDGFGDPEISTRIAQYEMAFRMQTSVPELTDLSKEPPHTFELYGEDAKTPGTFAANCLLARRLTERGVRFIQLFHRDWDHHGNLPKDLPKRCREVDQASAALVQDLKERGMLDETLVIWGGEFGRTVYCQGRLTPTDYGRDHHPRCFTIWMAGGGIKPGVSLGETDDYCYNITEDPVHVYDLQATILHCLGIDHTRLTYQFQGRHFRPTDIAGNVVQSVLA